MDFRKEKRKEKTEYEIKYTPSFPDIVAWMGENSVPRQVEKHYLPDSNQFERREMTEKDPYG